MFRPEKKLGPAPNFLQSLKAIILASWLNLLLVCIPVSWALNFAIPSTNKNKDTIVFVFSFLAIIPLAKLMGFATEELSLRVGQTLAGLLNATLIIALVKCQLRIVQASLVGSVLSNLLLVLGMCFFAGGVKYSEQGFGVSSTQLNSSLLTISVIAVLLPAAFHFSADAQLSNDDEAQDILAVSHGVSTSTVPSFIYAGYLWFQLVSHTDLYQDSGKHVIESTSYGQPNKLLARLRRKKDVEFQETKQPATRSSTMTGSTMSGPTTHGGVPSGVQNGSLTTHVEETSAEEEEEEEELPQMSVWMTIVLLVIVTVLVAITAEWLVDSIDGLTESGKISKEFVGIILLPIVGNAAEHVTAVTVSVKDKLTLSLGVAVGSSIQIALFVIPFIVILAWILGKPLTLLFDPFESIAMFLSVLTVNYVVQDGKSNWLEGFILMALYLILAVTFWFYPGNSKNLPRLYLSVTALLGSDPSGVLKTCT
ncbi:Sodium/calcium exchanger protein-domain-containing protein [Crassisporium funariophilum]|nr:Sodium/calcium exchanger protein-domain-containing protein [Crassisporium funariophilum]